MAVVPLQERYQIRNLRLNPYKSEAGLESRMRDSPASDNVHYGKAILPEAKQKA
jgi:hypothetical protein